MAKQIAIQDVQPGMVIIGVIEQNGPVKIRKSGLVTSTEMVQGLLEMGVVSVAIDPEQTVEIEPDTSVHVSQTQFVMQANAEQPDHDADSHLAEQFNRSLFLPSLQKVPSAWQYYGIKSFIAVVIVVSGFAFGWFTSQLPNMAMPSINGADITGVDVPSQSESETPNEGAVSEAMDEENSPETNRVAALPVDPQPQNPDAAEQVESSQSNAELNVQAANVAQEQADTEEGRVITNVNDFDQSNAPVSPEIMKRFEAAMADLERESSPNGRFADDGSLEYGELDDDYNVSDVQRVDQLPARVMTRLPNISFSAHMYASNPQDRWVKLNGIEMVEGDWFEDSLFLEKIEPQHVILIFDGHQFSMRALSEW